MNLVHLNKISLKRILLHALFWIVYIFYFSYLFGYPEIFLKELKSIILQIPFDFFVVYFSLYYLIPRYLEKEKYIAFFTLFIILSFSSLILQRIYVYEIIKPEESKTFNYLKFKDLQQAYLYSLTCYFVAIVIKIIKSWFEKKIETTNLLRNQAETKLKLKDAELRLLKAQIHPHFLFNTLNNLYGLTIKKSDLAPEIVIRLSEILDYMLYECNSEKVRLINEIKYLRNYIELEKIRYKKLNLTFDENNISNKEMIAPLLLLPFVENSFKHGVSNQINNAWIEIKIFVENGQLNFYIANSKFSNGNQQLDYTKGIGLKNVKKRLDLLYNGRYELNINETHDVFKVDLKLKL